MELCSALHYSEATVRRALNSHSEVLSSSKFVLHRLKLGRSDSK